MTQTVYGESDFYVAPSEPPISRRPPITTVGPLGWLRTNLFSSSVNSIATVIAWSLVVWFPVEHVPLVGSLGAVGRGL